MAEVRVIEIDRWGRFLVHEARGGEWRLPGDALQPGESPDLAAVRLFEALTGEVLDDLRLYPSAPGSAAGHVYYFDADLDHAILGDGNTRFHRVAPADLPTAPLAEPDRELLSTFAVSPLFKAMFH